MDLNLFKTFITVVRHQSISRASEEIFLTQPAVTKQIKILEQEYNIKLFERRHNALQLTEDGTLLLEYAHQILNVFNQSISAIDGARGQLRGTLHMGSNLTLGIYVLPKLIKRFSDINPELRIEIYLSNTEHIVRALKRNDVNFGFIGSKIKDPMITLHSFFQDRIQLVVGPDLGVGKKILSWKQLEEMPFITRERGSDIRETCELWLREKDILLKPKMELNNTEAIKSCVQCGIGFSLLPACTIENEVKTGLLRVVSAPYFKLIQDYYICHYKNRRFTKPEKFFLEFLFRGIES